MTLKRTILIGIMLNSIFLILNGVFMIIDPKTWYEVTGFYNQHFIRDIGIVQLFLGIAFAVGCFRPKVRLMPWGVATLWLIAHAIFHVWKVAVGICGPSALLRDFAAVSLPAIMGTAAILTNRAKSE